ncbi:hypothetical protein G6F23_014683 [Rhizopus arrhizus]|nr:hypothetical protein G6F23_014683 [Rhizopus arrhizus]
MMLGLSAPADHPTAFDPATFATQQAMAIASIALLLLGARITHFQSQHRLREEDGRAALLLARNSHLASEMDLRERAAHLRQLGDGMDLSLNEMPAAYLGGAFTPVPGPGQHDLSRRPGTAGPVRGLAGGWSA